jgi:Photosynthesis system II assembly factor YCF48
VALRGEQKPKSGLLRDGLAETASHAGACPDSGILAAYSERSLDAAEIELFETHLSRCPVCREQMAAMVHADESATASAPRAKLKLAWLWDWRWFAPAAAVLAFGVFWIARKPATTKTLQQPQSPVAMLQQPPAIERDSPSAAPAANRTSANAKQLSLGPRNYAPSREPKKEAVASNERETKTTGSQNGAPVHSDTQPAAASGQPVRVMAPRAPADASAQPTEGIVGGVVDAAPTGAAKQQPRARAAASELVSRYPANEKVLLQAANQRSVEIRSPDPQVLWRASGGGFIERSIDGGATWQTQRPVADARIVVGAALSPTTCWIAGRGGIILLTTDGTNWTTIPPPVHADFVAISARDDSSATVTTADGRKFATQDAGKKWQPAQ